MLTLPLNVVVPRKIGAPGNPELAIGAIGESGEAFYNKALIGLLGVKEDYLEDEVNIERERAKQRLTLYRRYAPLPTIKGKTILLIDDGIATGATMLAVIQSMRKDGAKRIIAAVPVAPADSLALIEAAADEVVCLEITQDFFGVSYYYREFSQTEDEEVIRLLSESRAMPSADGL